MNKLYIAESSLENSDNKTFFVEFSNANNILSMLRSDHFSKVTVHAPSEVNNSSIKFLMHISRLLSKNGELIVTGLEEGLKTIKAIVETLGLHLASQKQQGLIFVKEAPKKKQEQVQSKLSIGFKTLNQEQIDEDQLLKNENIKVDKVSSQGGCGDKPKACANCNCGRKKDAPLPSKQELVKSVNQGKPVSGCGKCYLGDSFRCATCPYSGLPAFKPGDKLKLVDNSNIVVENSPVVNVNVQGKVKIQI